MLRRNKAAPVYKLTPPNKLSALWIKAKTVYFAEAERKKPKVTKEITLFGKKVGTYKTRSTGIEKILKDMEKLIPGSYTSPSTRAKLVTATRKFGVEKIRLMTELNKLTPTAPEGVDKVKLAQVAKKFKESIIGIDRAIAQEENKLKNYLGETQTFKVMSGQLANTIKTRVGLAQNFINTVRHDPRPDVFNKDIQGMARGLTQQLGNIDKLTDMGFEFAFEQPTEMFERLSEWANRGRDVDQNANTNAVLAEVREFEEAVNAVAQWAQHI